MEFSQVRVRYIGAMKHVFVRTGFYITGINFIMLAMTTYQVVLKDYIQIPFWVFFLGLVSVVMVAMVFEFVVMMPSEIAFTNWQSYKHNNPVRADLKIVKDELEEIKDLLKNRD